MNIIKLSVWLVLLHDARFHYMLSTVRTQCALHYSHCSMDKAPILPRSVRPMFEQQCCRNILIISWSVFASLCCPARRLDPRTSNICPHGGQCMNNGRLFVKRCVNVAHGKQQHCFQIFNHHMLVMRNILRLWYNVVRAVTIAGWLVRQRQSTARQAQFI